MRSRSIAGKIRSTCVAVGTAGSTCAGTLDRTPRPRLSFERLHSPHEHFNGREILRGRLRLLQAQAAAKNGCPHRDGARMDAGKQGYPMDGPPSPKRAPRFPGALLVQSSDFYAAIFAALPSRTTFGGRYRIARGFIASGTTRKRSTCRSPFSRLAPWIWTWSASWKLRSKLRSAMPW